MGLNTVQGRPTAMTLADLVGEQTRHGFDLDFDANSRSIVTDFRESKGVLEATASDASRFASAAFQSIKQLASVVVDREQTAWSLIKAYYAAFYAGHAIIRLTGESCSYFQALHVNRLRDLGLIYGKVPTFPLPASAYHCVFNASATVVRSGTLREGAGGAHGGFWNVFGIKLGKISEEVLLGPLGSIEKQAVFDKLEEARNLMRAHNSPLFSYLSVLRNDIQYRHGQEVWLPHSLKKANREQLSRLLNQWKRDPMDVDLTTKQVGRLGTFAVACAFIVSVCRALLVRLAERSAISSRSFAMIGPLALLKAGNGTTKPDI